MKLPDNLKSGEVARLFPVIAETGKEQRASSILLSVLSAVPDFSSAILGQLGQRVGNRTKVDTFTEIVFRNDSDSTKRDRPDGLIRLSVGKRTWTCLIEAKIGNNPLDVSQVERYLRLARDNSIDALLTISNQFAGVPTHHPVPVQKTLTRKVELFHLSWSAILTEALLLHEESAVSDPEQAFLLREFVRFFSHASAGVAGFTSMPREWSDAVDKIQAGGQVNKTDGAIIVDAWHQEVRDLELIMSRIISCRVSVKIPRSQVNDPQRRIDTDLKHLCHEGQLLAEFEVPNAASPIAVMADLKARSLRISMLVNAPKDRVRNTARTNWILRQLKNLELDDVFICALWVGRSARTVFPIKDIQSNPSKLEEGRKGSEIRAYEITLTSSSARRFAGIRTFIEEIEMLAPKFYELIGQHLEAWLPAPPKPKHSVQKEDPKMKEDIVQSAPSEPLMAGNAHTDLLEIPSFLARQ